MILAGKRAFASAMEEVRVDCSVQLTERGIHHPSAGQSGLVGALASAYIDWSREHNGVSEDYLVRPTCCFEFGRVGFYELLLRSTG